MALVSFGKFFAKIVSTEILSIIVAVIINMHVMNALFELGLSTV
jgi:hypothetical protein